MYTRTRTQYEQVKEVPHARFWVLEDNSDKHKKMTFKLDKKQYFSGLASLVEVMAEMLENSRKKQKPPTKHHVELLRALREELDFLQASCQMMDDEE